jgi:hypothetical protein
MTLYPLPTFADNELWMLRAGPEPGMADPGTITPVRTLCIFGGFGWRAF